MNDFVPIYDGGKPFVVPPTTLAQNWFGTPARFACEFFFEGRDELLTFHFQARKPPDCEQHPLGTFVEGLWERDVAEFFVMGEGPGYQEFNLSPSGAWWSAYFRDYRDRAMVLECPSVTTTCESDPSFWKASLTVNRSDIVPTRDFSLARCRLNVAAVLDPQNPEFLCRGHHQGGEPDFHLRENFLPIKIRASHSANDARPDSFSSTDLF